MESYFSWTKHVNAAVTTSTTYATTDQVNEALGVIEQARAQGSPYFVEVAFSAPHDPFHKPPNHLHSRDALPPYLSGMDTRPYFEAMAEALDTEIGRLLHGVDLATTTVIFVGDNGTTSSVVAPPYPAGKSKSTVYQGGVRVPLLVAGAGVVNPGRLVPALANTVDLYPTILELAGIDPAAVVPAGTKLDGVSLLPYVRNVAHPGPRRWAYAERFRPGLQPGLPARDPQRALQADRAGQRRPRVLRPGGGPVRGHEPARACADRDAADEPRPAWTGSSTRSSRPAEAAPGRSLR